MLTNVSFEVVAIVIIAAIVAHVALIVGSRWVNPLFLIAGAYCFLAPLSAASGLPYVSVAKTGRVYVTLLLLFVGFFAAGLVDKALPGSGAWSTFEGRKAASSPGPAPQSRCFL